MRDLKRLYLIIDYFVLGEKVSAIAVCLQYTFVGIDHGTALDSVADHCGTCPGGGQLQVL